MTKNSMKAMQESSQLAAGNIAYIESLYENYLTDPNSIDATWRAYFDTLPSKGTHELSHAQIQSYFKNLAQQPAATQQASPTPSVSSNKHQAHVTQLINAYRMQGHHHADLDPLKLAKRLHIKSLDISEHGFQSQDLDIAYQTESKLSGNGLPLRDIISALEKTYCGKIGAEFMHITDPDQQQWIQDRLESIQSTFTFSKARQEKLLSELTAAEGLEKYLGSRFVGQKRFGLEGGESLIPSMKELIETAGEHDVKEIIIGMAHRGRLNMLVNVLGKEPATLFEEFEKKVSDSERTGDVKYHMGFSSDVATEQSILHLTLAFNPSHLEIISPVVAGSARARMRRRHDLQHKEKVVPILIHGDAAFAAQGVVMETFNFSQARGYCTGGSVHIVVNNQIGFTTSNPLDARSTLYCTDVAKMVQAPIFHVNGDDPEAVIFVTRTAMDFRMRFKKDVVIDLVCYRRHGHNEADEPAVTQPDMYKTIKQHPTVRQQYAQTLIERGHITQQQADSMVEAYRQKLDNHEPIIEKVTSNYEGKYATDWSPFLKKDWREPSDTTLPLQMLQRIAHKSLEIPDGFALHPVVKRLWAERTKMANGDLPLNWGFAETLAYATLLEENYPVRLSGQDSGRGTFAHRHAVLHDAKTAECFIPLQHITDSEDHFIVIDSVLSEEAVLAFEYGYCTAEPNVLVLWEGQFGDFVNGAQVVIDQFISSGEQKWDRLCGLVMLLPHGYEGQGPEHSSARLERFLQLCAQHNMQVCVPTTPAQVYHMLRRQMHRPFRKPLIVMTPKSLLRHKLATSTLAELANGQFELVLPEIDDINPKEVRKVLLCCGKVYYDLLQKRRENEQTDVAIIRIEQLYPFPKKELCQILKLYSKANDVVWCQEEPKNQGSWFASQHHFRECLTKNQTLHYVGRDFFASPAVGSYSLHIEQQQQLVNEALK